MILGICIDENFAYVNTDADNNVVQYPFAVGRNLVSNHWFVGEEARVENVDNVDIVIDKLFYLLENDGNARIGDVTYEAKDLARIFISNLLLRYENVEHLTIVVRKNNVKVLSKLKAALSQCIEDSSKYKVTTYSEAFISYIKSKGERYYLNPIALFDFTEKALTFYELIRYKADGDKEYWKVEVEEHLALPLDLLSGDTGKKICDNLLFDFAKKCLKEEIYNNIILTGLGFTDSSAYREFMTYVCGLTMVDTDIDFFAKAATMLSKDLLNDNFDKNVVLMTDARTLVNIKLLATVDNVNTKIDLIKPGEEWFEIYNKTFNVIMDEERIVRFECLKIIEGIITDFSVAVPEGTRLRKDKTNLFEVALTFSQQNLLEVRLTDIGFGEFYEPVAGSVPNEVNL